MAHRSILSKHPGVLLELTGCQPRAINPAHSSCRAPGGTGHRLRDRLERALIALEPSQLLKYPRASGADLANLVAPLEELEARDRVQGVIRVA